MCIRFSQSITKESGLQRVHWINFNNQSDFSLNLNFAKSAKNAGKVEVNGGKIYFNGYLRAGLDGFFYLVCFMAAGIITVDAEEWFKQSPYQHTVH